MKDRKIDEKREFFKHAYSNIVESFETDLKPQLEDLKGDILSDSLVRGGAIFNRRVYT